MEKQIQFITSDYKPLFTLPDGGYIRITQQDEIVRIRPCRFIDDLHLYVGDHVFHVYAFAVRLEGAGARCEPAGELEAVCGYIITDYMPTGSKVFVMGYNPKAAQPYGTWQGYKDSSTGYDWGHYFEKKRDAQSDLLRRFFAEQDAPTRKPAPNGRER